MDRIEPATVGTLGRPENAPYDRILVSAMSDGIPYELVEQLAPEGVMVIPVAGSMNRVIVDGGAPKISRHGLYRFVPLIR